MQTYSEALSTHLQAEEHTQDALAAAIRKSQAAVNRYAKGLRFPDADTAREIERATAGAVPFSLWQAEALHRLGIAA